MKGFENLGKIKELYSRGGNIIQYLKKLKDSKSNKTEDILISYDLQSGSYIKEASIDNKFIQKYCGALAKVINNISNVDSILEVGVGEATTLSNLTVNLKERPSKIFGFDISWSRLKFAKNLLKDFKIHGVSLFVADLFKIPLLDNSIDVVYTSHSIEPNGGKEKEALEELFRITKKYLILLEPSFEFANNEGRSRMKSHGYVTELFKTAQNLGYSIIEHRLFDYSNNPLNPTGIIIIKKDATDFNNSDLICPISNHKLFKHGESFLYSDDASLAYPILEDIPCLLSDNSILATHLSTNYDDFKKTNKINFL